jgi:hypothetical protein
MIPRHLSDWFSHHKTTSSAVRRRRRQHFRVEPLDGRVLLSATPPAGLAAPAISSVPDAGASTPIGLAPARVRNAYRFDQIAPTSLDGAGQTIAIVDSYDDPGLVDSTSPEFNSSDLHMFDQQFGLPDRPSFAKIGQAGGAPTSATDPTGRWEAEEALDVEWAHAIAPGANILHAEWLACLREESSRPKTARP